jgi:hypothetical protein
MSWMQKNIFDPWSDTSGKMMKTVHQEDRDIVSLIDPSVQNGPWIAGGAVLNWHRNEALEENDIDVFFNNLKQFDSCFGKLMATGSSEIVYSTENAVTIHYRSKNSTIKRVQLIRKKWFDNAESVINSFDFTVCQLVTDGYTLVSGEHTMKHIKENVLELIEMPPKKDIVKRLIKYVTYGYIPNPNLVQYIIDNDTEINWKFNGVESDYDAAF